MIKIMKLRIIISTLLSLFLLTFPIYAEDVLYITSESSYIKKEVELACQFYGLNIELFFIENLNIADIFIQKETNAIIINATALSAIGAQEIFSILDNKLGKNLPLFIIEITPETDLTALNNLSGGAVTGCTRSEEVLSNGIFKLIESKDIARELAGRYIPFTGDTVNYFIIDKAARSQTIAEITTSRSDTHFPVFIKTSIKGHEIFLQTKLQSLDISEENKWQFDKKRFFEIAPIMMFLRYACGERCWRSTKHYANLTIDDPWLTEPYGFLIYKGLLEEMKKNNFHTTIAFIPWNFDRSSPEVVSLFYENPEKLSICIHGNNHDLQEFYKYETTPGDPWPAKPLAVQEMNIKQALARMEKFKKEAGLAYDRVMVFPHSIAPAKTLGLLKKYNFLATVNAGNVPLSSEKPQEPLFYLRQVTLAFENFASLNRKSVKEYSQANIAIDLFLGNPILFYGHHDLFADGITGFNNVSEIINNIQPDIQWRSLGYIAQHLYLEKKRDDWNYDVMAFTSNLVLENTHQSNVTFFVRKEESFAPPIEKLTVDGKAYPYGRSGDDLIFEIPIPAGESRHIIIEYENGLNLSSIETSKNDLHINLLRSLSDFRDLTISTNGVGRNLIHFYYATGPFKLGLMRLAIILLVLTVLITYGIWYFRRRNISRGRS